MHGAAATGMLAAMWVLLSSRLRMWLIFTIVVPLVAAVSRRLARRIEAKHGSTRLSRGLRTAGEIGRRNRGKERRRAAV